MKNQAFKILKINWNKIKFRIFNNYLSITTNVLHKINHTLSKAKYSKTFDNYKKNSNIVNSLKEKGFVMKTNSKASNLEILAPIISKNFDEKKNLIYHDAYISYLNPQILDQGLLLKIFDDELIDLLELYFNSSFQIYSYHIYRVEENNKDDKVSHLWHVDNSTKHSIKLMFYLDDADIDSGAMLIVPKKKTKEIFQKGLNKREDFHIHQTEFSSQIETCHGKFGDYLIFQNSNCLHRINKPKKLKRDVININIYPSLKKLDINNVNLNNFFLNSGFSLNPFTNKPQNIISNEKIE